MFCKHLFTRWNHVIFQFTQLSIKGNFSLGLISLLYFLFLIAFCILLWLKEIIGSSTNPFATMTDLLSSSLGSSRWMTGDQLNIEGKENAKPLRGREIIVHFDKDNHPIMKKRRQLIWEISIFSFILKWTRKEIWEMISLCSCKSLAELTTLSIQPLLISIGNNVML